MPSNCSHLIIDGRRVSFDRRDSSVTLFPDEEFRLLRAEHIGYAEGSANRWTATAPDGAKHHSRGRKGAALWLIERTAETRASRDADRVKQATVGDAANEEAAAIIRTVWPDFRKPGPMMDNPDALTFYTFSPEKMRDLVVALTSESPRMLPLAAALERVVDHEIVLFSVRDPYEPNPFEWGYLEAVTVLDASDNRPDLGACAQFHFERSDDGSSMIDVPCLASTALVSRDAVVIEEQGGVLVIVIAEPAETLDVPGMVVAWEWSATGSRSGAGRVADA